MLENYESWLVFAKQTLGDEFELRQLILVTGCDLTHDWGMAVFKDSSVDASVKFEVEVAGAVRANVGVSWKSRFLPDRKQNVPLRCGGPRNSPCTVGVRRPQSNRRTRRNRRGRERQQDPLTAPDFLHTDAVDDCCRSKEADQCIFIRTLRVQDRKSSAPKKMNGGAGPHQLDGSDTQDPPPPSHYDVSSRHRRFVYNLTLNEEAQCLRRRPRVSSGGG